MNINLNNNLVKEVIRLKKIEFTDFRNIGHGSITFPNVGIDELADSQPSILGLYGQNGSGKTSVIIALGILKTLMTGKRLDESYSSCIRRGCERCTLEFTLVADSFCNDEEQGVLALASAEFFYKVDIANKPDFRIVPKSVKLPETKLFVENEVLEFRALGQDGKVAIPKQKLIDTRPEVSNRKGYAFGNATKYSLYADASEDTRKKLLVAKARRYILNASFVFSEELSAAVFGRDLDAVYMKATSLLADISAVWVSLDGDYDETYVKANPWLEIFQSQDNKNSNKKIADMIGGLDEEIDDDKQMSELFSIFSRLVLESDGLISQVDPKHKVSQLAKAFASNGIKSIEENQITTIVTELAERYYLLYKLHSCSQLRSALKMLKYYGQYCLHIIDTTITGQTNLNNTLPLLVWDYQIEGESIQIHSECINLNMDAQTSLPAERFSTIEKSISAINIVLNELIPELQLEIDDAGIVAEADGQQHYFEIMSVRNNSRIPLKYESDGVRRIISLASMFIAVYNEPSFTMVIDEIDSGIYEYLLGELLQILSESAQGQFIFTSHNLRPLEVLPAKYLCFTSVNPDRRFIKLHNRGNCNLRDTYFRTIILGSDSDAVYNPTDRYRMQRAFHKAGHVEDPK